MMKPNLFSFAVLICCLLGGCQTMNSSERAEVRSDPTVVQDERVVTDLSLRTKANVREIREGYAASGLLKVQAEIYNGRYARKRVNYRFDWIDESGLIIDTNLSRWTPLSLAGKEAIWVSGIAPTPRAVDFRLKLIEPND